MQKLSYSQRPTKLFFTDPVLNVATGIAVLVHVIPIFGLTFHNQTSPAKMMQDVAEVWTKDENINKKADFLAANNQKGSGQAKTVQRLESLDKSPFNSSQSSPMQDIEDKVKSQTAQNYVQNFLRTTISIQEVDKANDKQDDNKDNQESKDKEDRILAQIATLEAQVSRRDRIIAKNHNVKSVTSAVDSQKSPEASYINNFRKKVEYIGNQHYPEQARVNNLKGDVRLQVMIEPDGRVGAIIVKKSSGSKVLDEFAKQTVRQGAPYGNFTKEMKHSQLRLIRTWRFTDEDEVETFADEEL